jgi:hypothetical protein
MTASLPPGLALALIASVAQSAGFLFQHIRAAERPPVTPLRPLSSVAALFRSRWWLVGLGLGLAGFVLHLAAIALAPLSLVQAFVAGGLALAVPMAAYGFGHRLTRTERRSVLVMAASLAVLPVGVAQPSRHLGFDAVTLAAYLGVIALAALLMLLASGERRFAALGLVAGALYGVLDTVLKALTEIAHRQGIEAALRSPWLLVAVASILAAFFCFQRVLQTNRALTAIGLMEAGANSTSILAGFFVFGDSLGASLPLAVLHALAFCAVGYAAWSLAPAQERLAVAEDGPVAHGPAAPPAVSQRLA